MAHKAYMMGMFLVLLTAVPALAVNPAGYGSAGGEFNIKISRVPSNERAKAKATKSPFEATPEILAEGKEIFLGRGGCISCHGAEGKGDGAGAKNLPIQPRNSRMAAWDKQVGYQEPGCCQSSNQTGSFQRQTVGKFCYTSEASARRNSRIPFMKNFVKRSSEISMTHVNHV
jgi:hypothetical protein